MAKDRIADYDTTPGNNTDIGGINIDEGWSPANVNNAYREGMSQLADWHGDVSGKLTTAGTGNAYTITTNDGVAAYAAGQFYVFFANRANTGAATLNVNAIGAKNIVKNHDIALASGDIEQNQMCVVFYEANDDTFQLVSPIATQSIHALTQTVVQIVEATPYDTYSNTTSQITFNDDIPQVSEGLEIFSQAITPNDTTNRLKIEVNGFFGGNTTTTIAVALFQDGGADAIAAAAGTVNASTHAANITLFHEMAAGTTSSTTFTVRFGPGGSQTAYVNGTAFNRCFGARAAARMRITEYTT